MGETKTFFDKDNNNQSYNWTRESKWEASIVEVLYSQTIIFWKHQKQITFKQFIVSTV